MKTITKILARSLLSLFILTAPSIIKADSNPAEVPLPNIDELVYQLIITYCGTDGCSPDEVVAALNAAGRLYPHLSLQRFILDYLGNPNRVKALLQLLERLAAHFCSGQSSITTDGVLSPEEMRCIEEHGDEFSETSQIVALLNQILEELPESQRQVVMDMLRWALTSIFLQCGYIWPLPMTEAQADCIVNKIDDMFDNLSDEVRRIIREVLRRLRETTPPPQPTPTPHIPPTPIPATPVPVTPVPTASPNSDPNGHPVGVLPTVKAL